MSKNARVSSGSKGGSGGHGGATDRRREVAGVVGLGAALGEHLAEILRAMISTAGTALLALVGLVVAIVIATPLRMRDVLHAIWHGLSAFGGVMKTAALAFAKFWADVFRAILQDRSREDDDDEEEADDRRHRGAAEHEPDPGRGCARADAERRTDRPRRPGDLRAQVPARRQGRDGREGEGRGAGAPAD